MMNVLKRLAPRYWLGYYTVYVLTVIAGMIRYRRSLLEPTGNEDLYTMAAIFGVGAGVALTSVIITEAVGYVVLLIPRRIREIKEEGRAEGRQEGRAEAHAEGMREGRAEGRMEGRQEGRAEGRQEGRAEGRQEGRAEAMREARQEERERIARIRARYERGEITLDEFLERVSDDHCDVCHRPR